MLLCTNCGSEIPNHANFCTHCGTIIRPSPEAPPDHQKKFYGGHSHSCPHCGTTLDSFIGHCPACGCELRDQSAAGSVQAFFHESNHTQTIHQKEQLIRNFPIPNAKEDIIEFMILASSNILGEDNQNISSAWLAKFEQAYQKSLIIFRGHADFAQIQQIYDRCLSTITAERRRRISKFTLSTVVRNLAACVGIFFMLVAIFMDLTGSNSALIQLTAYGVLIASAASLAKRDARVIDFAVAAAGGLLTIILSFLLRNGSLGSLCGGIVLIIVAVNYFKSISRLKN